MRQSGTFSKTFDDHPAHAKQEKDAKAVDMLSQAFAEASVSALAEFDRASRVWRRLGGLQVSFPRLIQIKSRDHFLSKLTQVQGIA